MLRFASLDDDAALVEQAAQAAEVMLKEFPDAAAAHVKRWMGARAGMLDA
jgi:ATP-dependent DNA helicase RecG